MIALILGVAVGIFSAVRQYSVFDYTFTSLSFLGFAMPTFWLALLLQILFVDIYLKWNVRIFYTSGLNSHGNATWSLDRLQHIALPVITLTIISFALYSRYMRASMLDVINTDYVRTARAKGLPEWRVIMRHVFRNALIPIDDRVGAQLRRRARRRDRHRDRLQPRRDRLLLRPEARAAGRLRRDGVPDGHRGDHHRRST